MRVRMILQTLIVTVLSMPAVAAAFADKAPTPVDTARGDRMIADYFRNETAKLTADCLADIKTLEDWESRRGEYRRQLFEMLSLDPLPARTPLHAEITGCIDHEAFTVENVHFQSRPGLYVTGSLYLPKNLTKPAPTILYVCGHGRVVKDGISYGNKATYQHHGGWFARNGYVCLMIDTLQLGEIEGIHHGTYRHGMWWWNARGYTSAGVEAWNCIRALDYLQSRPEVDGERIGVTGRSGGGAYSWWIAALDDRIKVAVPVAGITSLQNHIVDGCVEGHCDCMYTVNTYRWDYPQVAALVAPRPLLISNTDKDRIFPLDGVVDVYNKVRRIYELYGKVNNIGLQITEGPHKDTQELRVHAFHWFNRFLKNEDPLIEMAAVKFFEPEQLKVFPKLPADERNTRIQEDFTLTAPTPDLSGDVEVGTPEVKAEWAARKSAWMQALRAKCFRGWPQDSELSAKQLNVRSAFDQENEGLRLLAFDFESQHDIGLRLYLLQPADLETEDLQVVTLNVLDEEGWGQFAKSMNSRFSAVDDFANAVDADPQTLDSQIAMLKKQRGMLAFVAPRGIGLTVWNQSERKQTHNRRRFMLLGQTQDGMRVWDVRAAIHAIKRIDGLQDVPLHLNASKVAGGLALYASLFEPSVEQIKLSELPTSHRDGPIFLNVLRYLDMPQAVALAAEQRPVILQQKESAGWDYPKFVLTQQGWDPNQLQIRPALPEKSKSDN